MSASGVSFPGEQRSRYPWQATSAIDVGFVWPKRTLNGRQRSWRGHHTESTIWHQRRPEGNGRGRCEHLLAPPSALDEAPAAVSRRG